MIIDVEKFSSLSRGSAQKVLCKCDRCGREDLIICQKIHNRPGAAYSICRGCSISATLTGRKQAAEHRARSQAAVASRTQWRHLTEDEKNARRKKHMHRYVDTECTKCGKSELRRVDAIRSWGGLCGSCRADIVSAMPHVKQIRSESGKRLAAEYSSKIGTALVQRRGAHFLRSKVNPQNLRRGPANHLWRGGITAQVMKVRGSVEIKEWRRAVFERDSYTCSCCGRRGGNLHADHILPFSICEELRFDVDNGRTLCAACHRVYGACVFKGIVTRAGFSPITRNERIG